MQSYDFTYSALTAVAAYLPVFYHRLLAAEGARNRGPKDTGFKISDIQFADLPVITVNGDSLRILDEPKNLV